MAEYAITDMFLDAHLIAHRKRAEIKQLLAEGVGRRRVLSLYPYDLEDWAQAIIDSRRPLYENPDGVYPKSLTVGRDLVMCFRGVEDGLELINYQRGFDMGEAAAARAREVLARPRWEQLLRSCELWKAPGAGNEVRESSFLAANDVLAIASSWDKLHELHQDHFGYRRLLQSSLRLLLPLDFGLADPLMPRRWDF